MAQSKIRSDRTAKPWTIALLLVGSALYVAALSTTLYEATSPSWLTWHVVLRKAYSVVAFATVGYLLRRSRVENGRFRVLLPCIAGMALYKIGRAHV